MQQEMLCETAIFIHDTSEQLNISTESLSDCILSDYNRNKIHYYYAVILIWTNTVDFSFKKYSFLMNSPLKYLISKTHSGAALQVFFILRLTGGAVEQPTAVQLDLKVCLGFVIQHPPS